MHAFIYLVNLQRADDNDTNHTNSAKKMLEFSQLKFIPTIDTTPELLIRHFDVWFVHPSLIHSEDIFRRKQWTELCGEREEREVRREETIEVESTR